MKGMAPILLATACLALTGCRPRKALPSPSASSLALKPLEMSLEKASPSPPDGSLGAQDRPIPSPPQVKASRPPLALSPKPSPSDTLRPAGSPPRLPRPEDIEPKPSPKRTPEAAARVPATGPFSLVPLGIGDFTYPEDFDLGPLEPKPYRVKPDSDPASLAYAFMEALSSRKETGSLVSPGRSVILAQALRPYLDSKAAISGYRVGELVRSEKTAEARIFIFGKDGARTVAELYMAKAEKGWGVEGFAGDLTDIDEGSPPPKADFEPSNYKIFAY